VIERNVARNIIAYSEGTLQGNRYTNSRRNFIFGCAAAGGLGVLAACGSGISGSTNRFTPPTGPIAGEANLFELMRKAGVAAYQDGKDFVVLPEYRAQITPPFGLTPSSSTCGQTPQSVGSRAAMAACPPTPAPGATSLPVIWQGTAFGNFSQVTISIGGAGAFATMAASLFGPGTIVTGPTYMSPITPGEGAPPPNCLAQTADKAVSAALLIAQRIAAAMDSGLYSGYPALADAAAGDLIAGSITSLEFLAIISATLSVGDLVALLAAVGFTLWALISYIKCLKG